MFAQIVGSEQTALRSVRVPISKLNNFIAIRATPYRWHLLI